MYNHIYIYIHIHIYSRNYLLNELTVFIYHDIP